MHRQASRGNYSSASANAILRDRGGPWTHGGSNNSGRGRGNGRGTRHGSLSRSNRGGYSNTNYCRDPASSSDSNSSQNRPCQVCFMPSHTTSIYWYRFDEEFVPDNCLAGMASSTTADPNWYLNSGEGGTDHITGELEKLPCVNGTMVVTRFVWPTV
jgi:hypothetical protein